MASIRAYFLFSSGSAESAKVLDAHWLSSASISGLYIQSLDAEESVMLKDHSFHPPQALNYHMYWRWIIECKHASRSLRPSRSIQRTRR